MKKKFCLFFLLICCWGIFAQRQTGEYPPLTLITNKGAIEFIPSVVISNNEKVLLLNHRARGFPDAAVYRIEGLESYSDVYGLLVTGVGLMYMEDECFNGLEHISLLQIAGCTLPNLKFLKKFKNLMYASLSYSSEHGPFIDSQEEIDLTENKKLQYFYVSSTHMSLEFAKIAAVPDSLRVLHITAETFKGLKNLVRISEKFDYSNIPDLQKQNPNLKFHFNENINEELRAKGVNISTSEDLRPLGDVLGWYRE